MNPFLIALLLALTGALALALLRAAAVPRASPPRSPIAESELEAEAGIEEALAALIRHPTVSSYEPGKEAGQAFEAFIAELPRLFPRVHAAFPPERVGERGLLYTWKGSEPSLPPAILASHFDVVPADDAELWEHGPFSGDIAEGSVWGRGAQDIKLTLASILFSAERLLERGFQPRRSLIFAFGGDEEAGGRRGAGSIAALLKERGIHASFLLDEGGPIAVGLLAMADRPLALVCVAEKGYADFRLRALGKGGHASMPPKRSAVGNLARALAAIEASPAPSRIGFTLRSFLGRLSPYVSFGYRLLFANLWLFAPLVKAALAASPSTNALLRTTAAPTMLEGSPMENVLAQKAEAIVNVRILPGETVAEAQARLAGLASRFEVSVEPAHPASLVEAMPESKLEHEGYRSIEAALALSFPEAAVLPFLFSASTDTKHYRELADAIYRLSPIAQTEADLARIHARNERIEIGNLRRCARFYGELLKNS